MNHNYIIKKLDANAPTFKSLLENISDEQARWKPSPKKWSLLEVINHLYDEEREEYMKERMFHPLSKEQYIKLFKYGASEEQQNRCTLTRYNGLTQVIQRSDE